MYTRTYANESGIVIPERYGGTTLGAGVNDEMLSSRSYEDTDTLSDAVDESVHKDESESVEASSFTSKSEYGNFLSHFLKKDLFSLQNFGKEEILIIAAAAFLLFSKEGDKECAIMLLLLLFFK